MDLMKVSQPAHGMWPTMFDLNTGLPMNGKLQLSVAPSLAELGQLTTLSAPGPIALLVVSYRADTYSRNISQYEYLLKQYLLSGKTEHRMAKLCMAELFTDWLLGSSLSFRHEVHSRYS
jgi:hypothetical protein